MKSAIDAYKYLDGKLNCFSNNKTSNNNSNSNNATIAAGGSLGGNINVVVGEKDYG